MNRFRLTGQRLAAIFLLGCILLDYPLLSLFDRPVTVFGVPLLYAYLFVIWAALILLMAVAIEWAGD